ncbi:hypothetical protein A2V56_04815 [Candidatus Woesebacteria bacterium RBG_19FT_COMBO_42_9]|uniref:DUF3800 domain-containing protein n=1 Tax=Candidatus Woesebacteria bacterium RBG_16_42_24 TaxID=1802485 RepID=A0A1F7XLL8_9BACT|nr:MAG: hypothetical protein A2V97_04050 [Candidatus Woesebacteria bacterium RBG_16_42_24]OGM17720.1 MAG: hypothetical protein A2V56_04815 [Candidatus Woesebacteria bacterium RBG_19FT_COMBO_42_9]OGM66538.1 MAG: hypothetical protein A2985_03035 [Candidatus Woesebacteria bacterium RIFCSPLOWO2_01_FULL_43_11]
MLVFIDDSGDPSLNIEKGASKFFVICCVVFDDDLEVEKTAVAIKELRRKLKFSDRVEFKFNGSSFKTRIAFLQTIKLFSFKIRALVVDKRKIKSDQLKNDKQSFYSYFIKMILRYSGGSIVNAKVKIDGSGDRIFRKRFLTYLRKELNSKQKKIVKNVRLVDSKTNVLIQTADMVAGTIRRYKEKEKLDAPKYWNIIKNKIDDCWDFK